MSESRKGSHPNGKLVKGTASVGATYGQADKGDSNGESSKSKGNAMKHSDKSGKGKSKSKHTDSRRCVAYNADRSGKGRGTPKDKGKGKQKSHTCSSRVLARDRYREPKCVKLLQSKYGFEAGHILDIDGQSKDGKSWLIASGGGTVPKHHEGIGWKLLHGDEDRPSRICLDGWPEHRSHVALRVVGDSDDNRSWLIEGGGEVPKCFEDLYFYAVGSDDEVPQRSSGCSSESSRENDCDIESSGDERGEFSQRNSGCSSESSRAADCDNESLGDDRDDWLDDLHYEHERLMRLDDLRDQHPNVDSDGLEDLYMDQMQADAEEFGGYRSDGS